MKDITQALRAELQELSNDIFERVMTLTPILLDSVDYITEYAQKKIFKDNSYDGK